MEIWTTQGILFPKICKHPEWFRESMLKS